MLNIQVNRLLGQRNIFYQLKRFMNNETVIPPPKVLFPLENRKLLRISGIDAPAFLHGLVTNDMRHFEEGAKSMYAMFLSNKGRVLYDTIIHKWDAENSFMVECDAEILAGLEKYLKIYRLKRLVRIENVNSDYRLWVLIAPLNTVPDLKVDPQSSLNIYKDPRLPELGFRILAASFLGESQISEIIGKDLITAENDNGYKYLRYKLGVCEGFEDLPPGSRFPLEVNCDYLHGVSFHKGCYIGQELLARVYYTGVVRKRVMPIKFLDADTQYLPKDTLIVSSENPKITVGKLIGCVGDQGLGLIRLKEVLEVKQLTVADHLAEITKPAWWPIEAPKEKITKTEN